MGGVDLSDQSVNTYRIGIRCKKWWWVLFTYMLDLAMTNAWKVYLLVSNNKISQLEFTRYIVRHYLLRPNNNRKRPRQSSVPESVRLDSIGHFPQRIAKPLRCVVCHARIRWSCKKCRNTLCVEKNCFETYHSQWIYILPVYLARYTLFFFESLEKNYFFFGININMSINFFKKKMLFGFSLRLGKNG